MDAIYNDLKNGKIKSYNLETIIFEKTGNWEEANTKAAKLRLRFLEEKTGKKFEAIKSHYTDTSDSEKNTTGIEQQIGGAVVPLGFAGPLKINGDYVKGEFYIPVATNEAALIAGLSRGISTVNKSGGIKTVLKHDGMARAPLIETPDIEYAKNVSDEIKAKGELFQSMKVEAEKESRVTKLIEIQPFQLGRFVHLRFVFQTGDSMGMNSATRYAANAIKFLITKYPEVKLKSLTANLCSDKKNTHINVLLGRGKSIETEVIIPREIIEKTYGIKIEDLVELNQLKNNQGSALAGTISGFNANVANTIAAVFIATGQDAAQITESASAFTRAEIKDDKLIFGCTFPCLEVATVGGGAGFKTAKECLEILGCSGPGKNPGDNARKLAEIIAAAATAQDLNLLGAEAHGYELADSHISLARGK
ncbi:MAG: hydroxymethylglutaryl-CoA reductase [Candidatus Aenigmarchaeota archaeon]|nr:hydroxymethylglutaryl-CoA reductase [Candidatus Aenigmarchaeota archaeon]